MGLALETRENMKIRFCPYCGMEGIERHPHILDIFNCVNKGGCKACFHIVGWKGTHWSFVPPYNDD